MSTTPSPLRSLLSGRPRSGRSAPDPADMGTCFGLEMTLTALPTAEPTRPAPQKHGWWQRFSPRKAKTA
jgi:hypothetical protein